MTPLLDHSMTMTHIPAHPIMITRSLFLGGNPQTNFSLPQGYNLLPPGVRLLTDTERSIPPLLLNIIRWFIHASYLLSETADQYKDRIFKLGNQNLSIFLLENMQRDLEGMDS